MKYKMKILTKTKVYEYKVKAIPVYEWDRVLSVNQTKALDRLYELDYLKQITNLMINSGFLDEFYFILNNNRQYVGCYKEYLIAILYSIQFDIFNKDADFKKPHLVYLEEFENNVGDFEKFDYINEAWNYEAVIDSIDNAIAI
ncbi:hypothetical protein CR532_05255 (plasmid) [Candidatus Borreliella tachyglossi]|uniref:Uncharacterized protein n=2 Tax=Candidatus Borreliella tachyglossi TaxID=1964448 RepID=A0A2S1LYG8_9SPIR|nr:hypothetical protein CR532_04975 [Candidatus Borreliella tachyglossi]AWG43403.1 hypothetical protein CR532_05255 [Candidatus Borreliella tachyglossi]